jgi:negative regulator of sigma E activity
MKTGNVVAGLALLAGSLALVSSNANRDPVGSLLLAAVSAPGTVSYTGTIQVVRIGNHTSEASVCQIEHRAPDLTRRLYSAPSVLLGDSVITKGTVSYSVDAKRHRVVETTNGAADDRIALNNNYTLLRQNYTAVQKGTETYDGRPTVDIMLVNKYSGRDAMLVRIDRETKIILDKQQFARDGSLVNEYRFEEIRYGVAVPPSDFALPKQYAQVQGPTFGTPSEDPDRIIHEAGFAARAPKSLPEGFAPVEGSLVELKGIRTMQVLYSDGIRTVSLFEDASAATLDLTGLRSEWTSVDGRSAEYAEDGAMGLLAWSDGSLHYALVGELSLRELQQIATSIAP